MLDAVLTAVAASWITEIAKIAWKKIREKGGLNLRMFRKVIRRGLTTP